jgi:hypothetical protein
MNSHVWLCIIDNPSMHKAQKKGLNVSAINLNKKETARRLCVDGPLSRQTWTGKSAGVRDTQRSDLIGFRHS